jgi:hypothetical protein
MILDHSSHKCDAWKLESIPTLVKWNLKAWKNCVYESQCSPSISLYMVHDHHSWVQFLTFKKPPPSQQNAWLHTKQIKVEFNNTCNLLLAITTFSISKFIHFTKLQHNSNLHMNMKTLKNKSIVNHQTTIIVVQTFTFKIETKHVTSFFQLDANYLIIPISCIYSTNTTLTHLIKWILSYLSY